MFGIMGIGADFINAAGRGNKTKNVLRLAASVADPNILVSCSGTITIASTKDGNEIINTYSNLDQESLYIDSDANSEIVITGKVTLLHTVHTTALDVTQCATLQALSVQSAPDLTSLDVTHNENLIWLALTIIGIEQLDLTHNSKLQVFGINDAPITSLDLSQQTQLKELVLIETQLTTMDVSACTELENGNFSNNPSVSTIKVRGLVQNIANTVGILMTSNEDLHGTLYTNLDDPYYAQLQSAAESAQWTVSQL